MKTYEYNIELYVSMNDKHFQYEWCFEKALGSSDMSSWHPGGSVLEANPTEKENIVWKAQLNCVYTWQNRSKPGVAQLMRLYTLFWGSMISESKPSLSRARILQKNLKHPQRTILNAGS